MEASLRLTCPLTSLGRECVTRGVLCQTCGFSVAWEPVCESGAHTCGLGPDSGLIILGPSKGDIPTRPQDLIGDLGWRQENHGRG